jgi:hypothetical protein
MFSMLRNFILEPTGVLDAMIKTVQDSLAILSD